MDYFVFQLGLKTKGPGLKLSLSPICSYCSGPKHFTQIVWYFSRLKDDFCSVLRRPAWLRMGKSPAWRATSWHSCSTQAPTALQPTAKTTRQLSRSALNFFIQFHRCFYIPATSAPDVSQNNHWWAHFSTNAAYNHLVQCHVCSVLKKEVINYFMICGDVQNSIGFILKTMHIRTKLFQSTQVPTPASH